MAGLLDFLSGLNNMLGAATYTRPQDIAAVRGLLPQSVNNVAQMAFASPASNDALGVLGGIGMAGRFPAIDAQIRSRLAPLEVKSIDDAVQPRPGHSYRFLTGEEYKNAVESGTLQPGPNSGGLLNFSTKPIAVYGASAWRSPGMLVEVPNETLAKYPGAQFYPESTDSSAFIRTPGKDIQLPLSDASRIFGFQWPGGGMKAADIRDLFYGRGSDQQ